MVLVVAALARFSGGRGAYATMAMDRCPPIGAWLRSRFTLRPGFRTDRARNARTDCSSEGLVVVGFYRYVRNPMYVGFFVGWIGLWVVFGRASWPAIAVAVAVILGVALFVQLYEEPTLHKMFGGEYQEYCRNRRWIPRTRPWQR